MVRWQFRQFDPREHPMAQPWMVRFGRRPGWVIKLALLAAAVVAALPVIVVIIGIGASIIVFVAVYAVLGWVADLMGMLGLNGTRQGRGQRPSDLDEPERGEGVDDEERENVKVIDWR